MGLLRQGGLGPGGVLYRAEPGGPKGDEQRLDTQSREVSEIQTNVGKTA